MFICYFCDFERSQLKIKPWNTSLEGLCEILHFQIFDEHPIKG